MDFLYLYELLIQSKITWSEKFLLLPNLFEFYFENNIYVQKILTSVNEDFR